MSTGSVGLSHRHREGLLSAVSVGFFFILVGMLFVIRPDLYSSIVNFVNIDNFDVAAPVPNLNISLPAPVHSDANSYLYQTIGQFSLVWGAFLLIKLAARFVLHSPVRKKADDLGDAVFWFGVAYLIQIFLVDKTKTEWFSSWFRFWPGILVLIGVSLIVRGIFLLVAWQSHVGEDRS